MDLFSPGTGVLVYPVGGDDVQFHDVVDLVSLWAGVPPYPDFQDFSDFFAQRPRPLVSFDLKLSVFVGHH